jgi:hypothetical protein
MQRRGFFPFATLEGQDDGEKRIRASAKADPCGMTTRKQKQGQRQRQEQLQESFASLRMTAKNKQGQLQI